MTIVTLLSQLVYFLIVKIDDKTEYIYNQSFKWINHLTQCNSVWQFGYFTDF